MIPPYYAVIFTSKLKPEAPGYADMSERMLSLARTQPGFLGIESARSENGFGITVSYWQDEKSIQNWRAHELHREAQEKGRTHWYESYEVKICRVERQYDDSILERSRQSVLEHHNGSGNS